MLLEVYVASSLKRYNERSTQNTKKLMVCLFDIVLYVLGSTVEVMSGWSVIIATLFLGKYPNGS